MADQAPFADPTILTAYLEANGWRVVNNIAVGGTDNVVSRVFEPDMELPFMISAQIMASEGDGALRLGLGSYFQEGQTGAVIRALTSITADIFAKSGLADPSPLVMQAFAESGEHSIYRGALNLDVVVADPDPDEKNESFALGISRLFAPDEWRQWVAGGLFDAGDAILKQVEARCRERLKQHDHALADVPLTLTVGTGNFFIFTAPDGEMVSLDDTRATTSISVIAPDGTIETLY